MTNSLTDLQKAQRQLEASINVASVTGESVEGLEEHLQAVKAQIQQLTKNSGEALTTSLSELQKTKHELESSIGVASITGGDVEALEQELQAVENQIQQLRSGITPENAVSTETAS